MASYVQDVVTDGRRSSGPRDLYEKLKWLTFFRLVVTTVLLGGTIALQLAEAASFLTRPLLALYGLTAAIFFLSAVYAWLLKYGPGHRFQAYLQIVIDTGIVSAIIFITGGFSSIFSFLYLVVVIYAALLLFRVWSLLIALLCGLQYGVLILLEYLAMVRPVIVDPLSLASNTEGPQLVYKVLMTWMACVMVALLGSLLAEQARRSRRELDAMEAHVKRVEKLAAVGEMAAGLAHEIKNPLASLSGSIQLLQEDMAADSTHRKLMAIVLRETDRLSALLNDFLLFARPPAKEPEPIDLEKVVAETVALFEKDTDCTRLVAIKAHLSSGVWVEMNPAHLRQVLWNLLGNAVEAMDGDGTVAVSMDLAPKGQVRLHIRDTGCGIPSEKLRLIFDPFYTTKARGTGLGLSIVHSILSAYGYRLDVNSQVGSGATFTINLNRIAPPRSASGRPDMT